MIKRWASLFTSLQQFFAEDESGEAMGEEAPRLRATTDAEMIAKGPVELYQGGVKNIQFLDLLIKENDILLVDLASVPGYVVNKTVQGEGAIYTFAGLNTDLPTGAAYVQVENLLPTSQDFGPFRKRLSKLIEEGRNGTPLEL